MVFYRNSLASKCDNVYTRTVHTTKRVHLHSTQTKRVHLHSTYDLACTPAQYTRLNEYTCTVHTTKRVHLHSTHD